MRGFAVRIFHIALLATVVCIASLTASRGHAASESTPQAFMAPGVTQAMRDIKLSMTVVGRIEGLLVKEGQQVRRDELLLHLDRRLEELEVQRRKLLLADTVRIEELRSKEKKLAEQVKSLRQLIGSGGVSRKQYEDEEMALSAVSSERKALEAAKLREQVELDVAIESFERRHLRSPMNGVVTKVLLHVGESVAANEPVMHLVDVSRVRFMGTVPSWVGATLREDRKVTIKLDLNGPEEKTLLRQGTVVFVSPVTDAASGLVEVIAEFDNLDGSVKPGISGQMMF
ncbi:efflux RND transporter periplasmic adaptor subunit [Candidatus Magnetaquicoccus inordinatus]|uniref:efflux RND transporter periplasmic adaptor subunit n=1 Tax=Candidatus Magnetaquicoccus inordinatus TaxID=2496818 RepID=UPI00102B6F85|nr:efflux RND transporter periplasmic adaptor subunit [Candidatus Magnetaquicoccus inordinatus]MBF0155374.1 efflux RND transporter periplasmic adaptor subunit [Magnetococcales bacterium]